ncbi:rhodanese-like domain-containing protein [Methylomonas sp. 11b]|uniref:rhodanese-like domain-containing protein n=1 Tax=Methylomonas sp. 11b TaxID=1168169 RepID=UPI00047E8815|nr:rhodanese-like domain-containing protein [Methylomonas sp. 11b]
MNKTYASAALALFLSGCAFQAPDYLQMVTAPELNQLMQRQDIFLVDVHTPEQRHIKGTDAFIPYNSVEKHLDKLPQDKTTPIYLYCEGGPMGNAAAKTLHELGYEHLSNLEGGSKAWAKAGLGFE